MRKIYLLVGLFVAWTTLTAFRCSGLIVACLQESDCADGTTCVASRCVAPPTVTCRSHDNCLPTQRCEDGACRGAVCHTNSDCLHYETCANKRCTPSIPCEKSPELCNGKDDDCDGKIDGQVEACYEGFPLESAGRGACRKGTSRCDNGRWSACTGQIKPTPEVCGDNIDNDCDGKPEEDCDCLPNQSRSCGESNTGICQKGTQACVAGKWGACQNEVKPSNEVCEDKIDNDCDGAVDEDCLPGPTKAHQWCNETDKRCIKGFKCHYHLCQPRCDENKGYENNPDCPSPAHQVCTGVCRTKCSTSVACEPHMHCLIKADICAPNSPPLYGPQGLGMACVTGSTPSQYCDGNKGLVCLANKCRQACDPRKGNADCSAGEDCLETSKSFLGGTCSQ